jgi:hypothetical protein
MPPNSQPANQTHGGTAASQTFSVTLSNKIKKGKRNQNFPKKVYLALEIKKKSVMIIATPRYDVVFKYLLEDVETGRGK